MIQRFPDHPDLYYLAWAGRLSGGIGFPHGDAHRAAEIIGSGAHYHEWFEDAHRLLPARRVLNVPRRGC
jgi:hypothetical protein